MSALFILLIWAVLGAVLTHYVGKGYHSVKTALTRREENNWRKSVGMASRGVVV